MSGYNKNSRARKCLAHSVLLSALLAPTLMQSTLAQTGTALDNFEPVTDEMILNPDPADWLMWRRTLDSWGYSPLDQINKDNVDQLRMVWTRGLRPGIQEGTALVRNGILYFPAPRDVIQAIDAKTGDLLWEYQRSLPDDLGTYFPVSEINRNLAIYQDLIIHSTGDNHLIALNAITGELVWETQIADYREFPSQQTSGPIIANGLAVSGRGCESIGGPDACVVTAHDALTGAEAWRLRVIPGPDEPNGDSWGDMAYEDRWHVGTWMVPSFDPELNLIIIGTSVTSPAPKYTMAGNEYDYLYHNSTLAIDATTGEMVWYYQHLVDHWDYDFPFERLLVDTAVTPDPSVVKWINPELEPGEVRKVVTGIPGKPGLIYTLDRATGEFLWATDVVYQNLVEHIDGSTGRVTINPDVLFHEVGETILACGGLSRGWPSGAYIPESNAMVFPLRNQCEDVTATLTEPSLDNRYGRFARPAAFPEGVESAATTVKAFSVETGQTLWSYEQEPVMMTLTTTGGGLIFGGDNNGRMKALDSGTGELLWEVNLGSTVSGYASTFMVDGKQYLSVSTGRSLYAGATDANNLFVFALPD